MINWGAKITPARQWLLAGLMLAAVLFANRWVLGKGNGFLFDDFSHLAHVKFSTVESLVHVLPQSRYNDRPVGVMAMKIMNQFFGLDFRSYHAVLLFIHMGNALLLFGLLRKVTAQISGHPDQLNFFPFLAAVLFGIWPRSTFGVQWLAGIFDLLGATFALLVFHLYAANKVSGKNRVFNGLLMAAFYYLGLRVKEMLLVIPVLLFIYDLCCWLAQGENLKARLKQYRPPLMLLVLLGMMASYYFYFMQINAGEVIVNTSTSPYFYTFNPLVLGTNFLRYLALYFDYSNFAYGFVGYSVPAGIGLAAVLLAALAGLTQLFRTGKPVLLALLLALAVALAPVLPMKNMQHMLYLYIPSFFLSAIIALVVNALAEKWLRSEVWRFAVNAGVLILALGLGGLQPVTAFRHDWQAQTQKNQASIADLRKISGVAKGTVFYVLDAPDSLNVFFYGPGAINRLLFNDESIITVLNPREVDRRPPHVLLRYHELDGKVERLE
jgi:hypothetical protein